MCSAPSGHAIGHYWTLRPARASHLARVAAADDDRAAMFSRPRDASALTYPATSPRPHGHIKYNMGFRQLSVRGKAKRHHTRSAWLQRLIDRELGASRMPGSHLPRSQLAA